MIEGHKLRVAEALSNVYTAERRLRAARWELDDRLAAATGGGHTQVELADWLGLSQQAVSNRLERRRARIASVSAYRATDSEGKGDPHGRHDHTDPPR